MYQMVTLAMLLIYTSTLISSGQHNIDCSGDGVYSVNAIPTDNYYALPKTRFLSNNLFIVGWRQNDSISSSQYRFYTISKHDNAIDPSLLYSQYEDKQYSFIYQPSSSGDLLSGYLDPNANHVHLTMSFNDHYINQVSIITETIALSSDTLNVTNTISVTNLSWNIFYYPFTTNYVAILNNPDPETFQFFLSDTKQFMHSSEQIELHSVTYPEAVHDVPLICFSSDVFVLFTVSTDTAAIYAISFTINGDPTGNGIPEQIADNTWHPFCKTRNDGKIILCHDQYPGPNIVCHLINPINLNIEKESTFALLSIYPEIAIYPNDQFVLCYRKGNHVEIGALYCMMMDSDFTEIVSEQQVTHPDVSKNETDLFFNIAQVTYGNQYRFIIVWQRATGFNATVSALDNDYNYIRMMICQDSYQSLSPTDHPTLTPTLNPTFLPTANPSFLPTASPTFLHTANPTLSPSISITNHSIGTVEIDTKWIRKEALNCQEGFTDLDENNPWYNVYCQECPEDTAGTYGQCDKCGVLEEPNHARTDCEFVSPWWLYIIEILCGLTFCGTIGTFLYRKLTRKGARIIKGNASCRN